MQGRCCIDLLNDTSTQPVKVSQGQKYPSRALHHFSACTICYAYHIHRSVASHLILTESRGDLAHYSTQ